MRRMVLVVALFACAAFAAPASAGAASLNVEQSCFSTYDDPQGRISAQIDGAEPNTNHWVMVERSSGEAEDGNISWNYVLTDENGAGSLDMQTYNPYDPLDGRVYVKLRRHDENFNLVLLDEVELPLCVSPEPGPAVESFDFPSFPDADALQLNGDATHAGDAIRLVGGGADDTGSAFATNSFDATKSWSAKFRIRMDGTGEGAAFVLQSEALAGVTDSVFGGQEGHGYRTLRPHLAVDLSQRYRRVWITQNGSQGRREDFPQSEDPTKTDLHVWVDYGADLGRLNVFVSATDERPATPTATRDRVNLAQLFGDDPVFAGFAAATSSNKQMTVDVLSWKLGPLTEQGATPTPPDWQPDPVRQRFGGAGFTYGEFRSVNEQLTVTSNRRRLGQITDYGDGYWEWNATGLDRASGPQTITVTATDDDGRTAQQTFVFNPFVRDVIELEADVRCVDTDVPWDEWPTATLRVSKIPEGGPNDGVNVFLQTSTDEPWQGQWQVAWVPDDGTGARTGTGLMGLYPWFASPGESRWYVVSDPDDAVDNSFAYDAVRVRFEEDCSTVGPDADDDGVADADDAFPDNPAESADTDGDGTGDNADELPEDPAETKDSDEDGVGDNTDAFDDDPKETKDTDSDGVGDNGDEFPDDPKESKDTDGDGVGDNADELPGDPNETKDSDSDGIGDKADPDDDNDNVPDTGDDFPNDPKEHVDTDEDGTGDNADLDDDGDTVPDADDAFPLDKDETVDTDGDMIGNKADLDDDGDGVADTSDRYPLDAKESTDTDGDDVGDNADPDDDNDGTPDTSDAFPTNPAESKDADEDGVGNNEDTDDDNDGVLDTKDLFPTDPKEQVDSDKDGTGDNADLDDDNDGVPDTRDNAPLTPNADQQDLDGDGVGDVLDTTVLPASKEQCAGDGWKRFYDGTVKFKNRGDCASLASGGKKSIGK